MHKRGRMSDLLEDPEETGNSGNAPEFTVSEISGAIKRVIEGEFGHVRIRGEIGRVSRPRSGHVYLDLKDDRSVISGVIWKGVATRLAVRPEEGLEVVAIGRVTTFSGQSKYQIVIEDLRPAGQGALMAMLEARRKKLEGEGLFAAGRKQDLPYLPDVIGVITSPSGAVIRDILHRLRDRFPRKVLIWPVAVQGDKCAPEVVRAIAGFNAMTPGGALPRPDLLIVARGGGSVEDLWGFNEESVVRAAADSAIPLISAVGHETDTTLIDHAADRRAPTPTAAAELAVPVRHELLARTEQAGARMSQALSTALGRRDQRLRDLSRALPRATSLLEGPNQRLDRLSERLPVALKSGVDRRRVRLLETSGTLRPAVLRAALAQETQRLAHRAEALEQGMSRRLEARREKFARLADKLNLKTLGVDTMRRREVFERLSARLSEVSGRQVTGWQDHVARLDRLRETLSYKATLTRGYAVVRGDGAVVTTRAAAGKAQALEIEFADGRMALGEKPGRKPAAKPKSPEQGSLF